MIDGATLLDGLEYRVIITQDGEGAVFKAGNRLKSIGTFQTEEVIDINSSLTKRFDFGFRAHFIGLESVRTVIDGDVESGAASGAGHKKILSHTKWLVR